MNYLTETLYGTEYRFDPPDPRWCFFRSLALACEVHHDPILSLRVFGIGAVTITIDYPLPKIIDSI